jgi:hypothetical protein
MEWYKYYDMFNLINEHIEKELLIKDTIKIYGGYPFATKDFVINISKLEEHANHHFEQLKNVYIEKSKRQNIYSCIDSELKDIIVNFANNQYTYSFVSNEGQKVLLYYYIDRLIQDLTNNQLKGEARNSQTFYRLWAYSRYWFWLHKQNKTYGRLLNYRPYNVKEAPPNKKTGMPYREDNDLILEIILTNDNNPYNIIEELVLYLNNIQQESTRRAAIFKIKKIAYDYYQKDRKEYPRALPLAAINLSKNKEKLKEQYIQIIDYLNEIYGINISTTKTNENARPTTHNQKLIWNGQKNTLVDIFHQLRNMTVNKKGTPIPLIDNSYDEIATFLKENFHCFDNTTLRTVHTTLTKEENKPKKSTNKITLIQGFETD